MMSSHKLRLLVGSLVLLMMAAPDARAQFAVIDAASIARLVQQAQTLSQQLQVARAQILQAQSLYQSTTGSRGMQQLLSGVPRNYLPSNWSQLNAAMQATGPASGALSQDIRVATSNNALLSASQIAALPAGVQPQIANARRAVALEQAVAQEALANSSGRFASIQQLITTIGSTTDQKGILELHARIGAEQGMLQNEQTKLQVLYQLAQSQSAVVAQQAREQIIAGHGSFASRFQPAPR